VAPRIPEDVNDEIPSTLRFHPDRLGHGVFANDTHLQQLMASKIPLEICLGSNLASKSVHQLELHPFRTLFEARHPLAICTDDPGLFNLTLSDEYLRAKLAFGLSRFQLAQLSCDALKYSFCEDPSVLAQLTSHFQTWLTSLSDT